MKYTITGTEVVRLEENFGVIQNLSCSVAVELSSRADFVDSWILYPLNNLTFNTRLYVRAPAAAPVELNVVTFAASGTSNSSSSAAVNDEEVASDDEANEYFDSIFGGN